MKKEVEVHGIFIAETRYELLQNVVNHLVEQGFQSKAGLKIEDDESFKSLQKTAEDQIKQPYFIFCFDKYPDVGLLHRGFTDLVQPYWEELPFFVRWYIRWQIRKIKRLIHHIDYLDKAFSNQFTPESHIEDEKAKKLLKG